MDSQKLEQREKEMNQLFLNDFTKLSQDYGLDFMPIIETITAEDGKTIVGFKANVKIVKI